MQRTASPGLRAIPRATRHLWGPITGYVANIKDTFLHAGVITGHNEHKVECPVSTNAPRLVLLYHDKVARSCGIYLLDPGLGSRYSVKTPTYNAFSYNRRMSFAPRARLEVSAGRREQNANRRRQ